MVNEMPMSLSSKPKTGTRTMSTEIENTPTTTEVDTAATTVGKKRKSRKHEKESVDGETTKKKRMTRKMRYPLVTAPCRIAYQFYIKEKAAENKLEGGAPKSASHYAAEWKQEKDRSKWEEMARQDLENFKKEVEAKGYKYVEPGEKKSSKKPSGSFLLFARDYSKRIMDEQNLTYQQALPILGDMWRNKIDPAEKQRYIDEAARQKAEYEEQQKSTPTDTE